MVIGVIGGGDVGCGGGDVGCGGWVGVRVLMSW